VQGYPGPQQPQAFGVQPGPNAPKPAKRGMNGCLMVALAVLAIGIVGAAGVGLYLYFEFREYVGATAEMGQIMTDAQSAPGASDVKAAGCEKAAVLDLSKFEKVMDRFEKESARREGRPPKPLGLGANGFMVTCSVTFSTPPSCADVARAFIKSQHPTGNVVTTVSNTVGSHCQEEFDPSGAPLGAKAAGSLPTLPSK